MSRLFISHAAKDGAFVRRIAQALAETGQDVWIDSREHTGGDPPWQGIATAIELASAYVILVSPDALQSRWVGRELRYALDVQRRRGKENFPVIPFSLNGTSLGVLEEFFGEEPLYIPVSSGAGGTEAAVAPLLAVLGRRGPADIPATTWPAAQPVDELVLELTDLAFEEQNGTKRASARARLVYEPAASDSPRVYSNERWRFVAPLGPIEFEELRWYLEKYAIWPSRYFRDRARKIEGALLEWGRLLHETAIPHAHARKVMNAWEQLDRHVGRRFSVYVDAALDVGSSAADVVAAQTAATVLMALPWELLHDGDRFLFQGAEPTRVRRRLPSTYQRDLPVSAPPIRVLLISARPEDDACVYIDHRASALPLVEALEGLGNLAEFHLLDPPTLPSLVIELETAAREGRPYHVVHFDGHGFYDRQVGLGALGFEDPRDIVKLELRRHVTVFTNDLAPLLREHRIPLLFLEACQTATSARASESVASDLLKVGVASVVAMSHGVLVETARRFVAAFYAALAEGGRVGDAMLAGQRALKEDNRRGIVFGEEEFTLEDWFVPVLFQEKEDPQLFRAVLPKPGQTDAREALSQRLGEVPPPPNTGFIGRSRDLLALQRLLKQERYALLRGQGGEGKSALAAEFARWMVRSRQKGRAAFVSVETQSTADEVLDAVGRQLVPGFSVASFESFDDAVSFVVRALGEHSTLLIVDNVESILPPPHLETPETLSKEAQLQLEAILALCARLNSRGETSLLFTSREALPAPWDGQRQQRELLPLEREDAVKLVERVISVTKGDWSATSEASREEVERLVDAVRGHARTLALLAPSLQSRGVAATRESIVSLMVDMERNFPGDLEQSVFASIELSLRRLSPTSQERARALGMFHGGFQIGVLTEMMRWEPEQTQSLAHELVATGLATPHRYGHCALNPAFCPYMRGKMLATEREAMAVRWIDAMRAYAFFLSQQQTTNSEAVATLTVLDLPNFLALIEELQRSGDPEATSELASTLCGLIQMLGRPRLLARIAQVRDAAVATLEDTWSHTRFQSGRVRIQQLLADGQPRAALENARALLARSREAGDRPYPGADYDLAGACYTLATVLNGVGAAEEALSLVDEAQQRFQAIELQEPGHGADKMVSVCMRERATSLFQLGRLDEAAATYEAIIRRTEASGNVRERALATAQLGSVRLARRQNAEGMSALHEALELFRRLDEPGSIAVVWHQIGSALQQAGESEAAEDAYRKALALDVRLGNPAGQANTLMNLGNLYASHLDRFEEAVAFYRQAAAKYVEIGDVANEGRVRNNLGATLKDLRRLPEAREEIQRALACKEPFGHAAEPWTSWALLAGIETEDGASAAAAEAKRHAVASYLAYRRNGGENHFVDGRLSFAVTKAIQAGDTSSASESLKQVAAEPSVQASLRAFVGVLQLIIEGNRDPQLADTPDLNYRMTAEVQLLIERTPRVDGDGP
jgi:tetratricopeptide (TPR) repeat protein